MISKGAFGYIIGNKKRIMDVDKDADLLWQILVREIYVLMKHFQSKENLLEAFNKIKTTKCNPKQIDKEKFNLFTNLESSNTDWTTILYYCQASYINILESGYIVQQNKNNKNNNEKIFVIDFNKDKVLYYSKDLDGKTKIIETASLEEIMNYEEMPTKSYSVIIEEMYTKFTDFYEKYSKIEQELQNLDKLKIIAKNQNAINIEEKLNKLIDDMNWEKKKLHKSRKVFYDRLKSLDLIEEPTKEEEEEESK